MPKFPKKEAEILALVKSMSAGYVAHIADFPSVIPIYLIFERFFYENTRKAQIESMAQMRLATEAKLARLRTLKEVMKSCLKRSEVDTAASPEKLVLIGWGPKTAAQMIEAPSAPMNLRAKLQGKGTILLLWDSPTGSSAVRNYIIQRRQQPAAGDNLNVWSIAGSAIKTEINLTDQPRGVQLEYLIKATNTGGESTPSNTIMLVL